MPMNPTEHDLELCLRRAPAPRGPSDLEDRLIRGIRLPSDGDPPTHRRDGARAPAGGWRRWFPWFLPAVAAAGLATAVGVQQGRIGALKGEVERLRGAGGVGGTSPAAAVVDGRVGPVPDERAEIARLREWVASLTAELAAVEAVEAGNARLRESIAALEAQLAPEIGGLIELRERAFRIRCVNQMKQLGLAVRVWATDNDGDFPPNIHSMSNELVTPKVLVCPADPGRTPGVEWGVFAASDSSYEFLAPGPGRHERDPSRVMWRCPFHGNITMCDGSVQMGVALEHPEQLHWRNGVLYYEAPAVSGAANRTTDSEPVPPSQP